MSAIEAELGTQPWPTEKLWRPSMILVGLCIAVLILSILPFRDSLAIMWSWWLDRPEYSHGVLMPLLAAFLILQQRDQFERKALSGSWWGVFWVVVGAVVYLFGRLASVMVMMQYAYVIILCGLLFSLAGGSLGKRLFAPCMILVLMVPLPEFIFQNLTASLQLISSKIGVAVIRLFGVSVYLEGNVIDLGSYKLEVAEACSGLRYLFPLMTLGFIMAWLYQAALWKRALVFLSSIPVTILMNSLRIGLIGVLVDHFGAAMAEGVLHDFEGWVMFMASTVVMVLEIALLSRIGRDRRPWREAFALSLPPRSPAGMPRAQWQPNAPFIAGSAIVAAMAVSNFLLPPRTEIIPARADFAGFPSRIAGWEGRRTALERVYVDQLKMDDYIMADYSQSQSRTQAVNFYVAWYDSQRAGQSAHSPRTCIPGGGWQIKSLTQTRLDEVLVHGRPLEVNRVIIGNGANRQVVYYWFQQRGRVITNEYLVKWFLFWDSLMQQRSDGALVRLVLPVANDGTLAQADDELTEFARAIAPMLTAYVPG